MRYFARRIAFLILTLWAAVTLNFLIPRLMPGDPARTMVSRLAGQTQAITPAMLKSVRIMLGVPHGSLLEQYGQYWQSIIHGKFGVSYTFFPYSVTHMIGQAIVWTLVLVGVTHLISFAFGTMLGAFAAWKRNGRLDAFATLTFTFTGTLPFFWIALVFIFVFAFILHWFPISGAYGASSPPAWNFSFFGTAIYHSILPALAILITAPVGWIMGMRNNMIQTLGEDYTRLAKAKGLKGSTIALSYGARNAILPNITGFAISLGHVVGGVILVEVVFNYPGMGRLLFQAVTNQDYPLMQAIFLLITIGVLFANFIADLLYGWLDPQVRRGGEAG